MTYYAEEQIDRVLRETFFADDSYKGVIVEVGAAGPELLSVSRHFRESGWRVVAIEPNPEFCELHRQAGFDVLQSFAQDIRPARDLLGSRSISWAALLQQPPVISTELNRSGSASLRKYRRC